MTTTAVQTRRAQLIKLIHVARRELERDGKMDEPTYRTMLRTAGGKNSTKDMDVTALERVLDQAKLAGFKVRAKGKGAPAVAPRTLDRRVEASKVRALWLFLHELGAIKDPSEAALAAYVKRIARVDDLHWAHDDDMTRLIETLKKWAMRFLPAAVQALDGECQALARAGRLSAQQQESHAHALALLRRGTGFDLTYDAWATLMAVVLARPIGVVAGLGAKEGG